MKKALLLVSGAALLVCHVFAQSPASSEVNRIVGAQIDVKYNEARTEGMVRVTNVSKKIITTVRIALAQANGSSSRSISGPWDLKPGARHWETVSNIGGLIDVDLDAIVYTDGSLETRNDAVAAEMKVEAGRTKEQHEKEMEYARAFAAPDRAGYMPQEEQIVRSYYAKLSFLAQLQVLANVSMHGSPAWTEATVRQIIKDGARFDLSEFQTGDFAEIETLPWTLLLNPDAPQGIIEVNRVSANIGVNHHDFSITWYQVWRNAQIQPEQEQERREQMARAMGSAGVSTVKDAVRLANPGDWSRYASFTVLTRLRGQAITYRATFLFARHGEAVAVFDPAMRVPIELNGPFYPTVLVDSVYRELPFFKTWVADNQLSGCKRLKEPEICCDPYTSRCGLASEDVAHSLTLPIDDNDRWVLKGLMEPAAIVKKQADAPCPVTTASDGKK
jgi:sRNA-binding protein